MKIIWVGIVVIIIISILIIHHKNKQFITLWIKDVSLEVEVSDTSPKISRGLMYRKKLHRNRGMLFIFDKPGIYPFWMKNTYIPLAIAFITEDTQIVQIDSMYPLDTLNLHIPIVPIKYAIEVNQSWFSDHKIKVGDIVKGIPLH